MTDDTPIHRLESTADGLRVVTKDPMDLARPDRGNVLTREYADLFTVLSQDTVTVGSALHIDDGGSEGWHIAGAHGIVAEVPIVERDLTDAERAWCEGTFIYRGTESVAEFTIPHPEDLRAAIREQDRDRFACLTAVIEDADRRHDVLTTLQDRIEESNARATKLHPRKGYPIDLPPEWDPENGHNDGKSRDHVYDMVSMRKDAHLCDFETVAGFGYWPWKTARQRVLGIREPWFDDWQQPVALDVAGYDDWNYCRLCGAIAPGDRFLHVQRRGADDGRTVRCCDRCADRDTRQLFDDDAVARAQDERATRTGEGQRRIGGDYV